MCDMQLKQCKEILEETRRCMARVLDDCELELGDSPRWKLLRSRILSSFGDRGLSGKVIEIINSMEQL